MKLGHGAIRLRRDRPGVDLRCFFQRFPRRQKVMRGSANVHGFIVESSSRFGFGVQCAHTRVGELALGYRKTVSTRYAD